MQLCTFTESDNEGILIGTCIKLKIVNAIIVGAHVPITIQSTFLKSISSHINNGLTVSVFSKNQPDRDNYKISYTLVVKFKTGEIKVDKQNKRYTSVKKGEYSGKNF